MDCKIGLGALVIFLLQVCTSQASHFRGGTVSWKHLASNGNVHQIEVNYRAGYRRNWESPHCDDDAIASMAETYLSTGARWRISEGYQHLEGSGGGWVASIDSPPIAIICTAYDSFENWAYGYNSFVMEVYSSGPFTISYEGNAWIGGLYQGGSSWVVPALIDLGMRSDTGVVNTPPRTFSPPVVRLQQHCPQTIRITSVDDDGDRVTCRYAGDNNTLISNECGGVCNVRYPHFSLDENTCELHYDGGGGTYLIPVAMMLEDHPSTTITIDGNRIVTPFDYLSQIPLQFLVDISSTTACNIVPSYPNETLKENDTVIISNSGGALDEVLYAYPSEKSAIIIQFVVLGPLGVQASPPIYINATGAYASNITWYPDPNQAGRHVICYYALDSLGKSGQQVCFTVEVTGLFNPCDIDNGGCNDICLPQGPTRTCDCSLPCWSMMENKKTCSPPIHVTCNGLGMEISLPSCASNKTVVVGTDMHHFSTSSCHSYLAGSAHKLEFSRYQCGVTEWANSYQLRYDASLWIWHGEQRVPSIITRGEWKRIPIACSVSTSSGTVNGSFIPILPFDPDFFPSDVTIEGMGVYSFFFEFYTSASFTTAVSPTNLPLQVSVNDRMYFSLGAVGQGGLVFFTEECTAKTTDINGVDTLSYTFIKDGCFLDSTLMRHYSGSNMEDKISMQAFEFENKLLANRQDAEIFMQCQVMLCDASNISTRCFQGCQQHTSRRKRSEQSTILSRIVQDVGDDDEDEATPTFSRSQSPSLTTSSRIHLLSVAVDDHDSSGSGTGGNFFSNAMVFGISLACFIMQQFV